MSSTSVCNNFQTCVHFAFLKIFPYVGVFPYVLIDWVLLDDINGQFKHPFYKMCLSLSVSDILGSINKGVSPYAISAIQATPDNAMLFRIYGFIGRYFWYVCELHHLLVATARLIAVFFSSDQNPVFENPKVLCFWLGVCWVGSGILNVPVLTVSAAYIYDARINQLTFNASSASSLEYQEAFDFGIQPCISLLQLVFYMLAVFKLRIIRGGGNVYPGATAAAKAKRKRRTEFSMVVQGFLSFLPVFVVVVCFHILVYLKQLPSAASTVINILLDVFGYFVYMGSPFVYYIFNHAIREKVHRKLRAPFVGLLADPGKHDCVNGRKSKHVTHITKF